MGRDKARDDKFFNCDENHEFEYVASLYKGKEKEIKEFLFESCENNSIKYSTRQEVYALIEDKLGYPIPVHV